MHKNNRLKESISAFFSRFVISFHFISFITRLGRIPPLPQWP